MNRILEENGLCSTVVLLCSTIVPALGLLVENGLCSKIVPAPGLQVALRANPKGLSSPVYWRKVSLYGVQPQYVK